MSSTRRPLTRGLLAAFGLGLALASCQDEARFARAKVIESMAETIGGPAASARPGDILLENDRIRAVVHGRHNQRSTFPIGNGSLVDLDLQRPYAQYGNGRGKDAFYELGPMINLKINSSLIVRQGRCNEVGASPCPQDKAGAAMACARVSAAGGGDTIFGILGLLDLAIKRSYATDALQIVTDYDVCPGEALVRITTTARFFATPGNVRDMDEIPGRASLLDALLGETSGIDCAGGITCPDTAPFCDDLLVNLSLGSFKTEMKRCRTAQQGLAGVVAGDFAFFSAKARIFLPGFGYDHETFSRSVFDTGGDIFSNPMSLDFVSAVNQDVSYVYFNEGGKLQIPIFSEAFTLAMTNRLQCPRDQPGCFQGEELRFRRYVAVGRGDVASALEGFYAIRGIETGKIEGHVLDLRTRKPLSGAEVFVFSVPPDWQSATDAEIANRTYDALVAAHRAATIGAQNPIGEVGLVSQMRADPSMDFIPDASFSGSVPPGRYILATRDESRGASRLVPIKVEVGKTTGATVFAADPAILEAEIRDDQGRALPSKLTFGHCFPECARDEDCAEPTPVCDKTARLCTPRGGFTAGSCRPDQRFDAAQNACVCPDTGKLPLELGGHRFADGTVRTVLTANGKARVQMEPGVYQVVASRGIEHEIDRRFVTLTGGAVTRLSATLPKVIDRKGWVTADFHVHGPNSVDSGLTHETRVLSYAAEGVDLISSSDHDNITDYTPTIFDLRLQPWVKSQVGVEISPLDYGHFIGFPLTFDQRKELGGGFHWRADSPGSSPDWRLLPPGEIYQHLRERGLLSPDETVTFIAHFYDNFQFFSVDPWTLESPNFSISTIFNPVVAGANFSGLFDGLEVLNGKNFDTMRRPSRAKVTAYNQALTELVNMPGLTFEGRLKLWSKLSSDSQRAYLLHTPAEQELAISYDPSTHICRCTQDGDCGATAVCDDATGGCVPRCTSNAVCDSALVAAGREACDALPVGQNRKVCRRKTVACSADSECGVTWGASTREHCLSVGGAPKTCEVACTTSDDCRRADSARPICQSGVCIPAPVAASDEPCPTVPGTLDDWFQMLMRGVRRPLLANSDSHSTYDTEAGIPRTYIRSTALTPAQIDPLEIARNVRAMQAFGTYGPFVELTVNGQGYGSTVAVRSGDAVTLKLKIQSPKWFDVDRVEIYRNGALWKEINGSTTCAAGAQDCIKVPNDKVVKLDATFSDTPDRDTWYVVVAMGLDGKTMAPVYSSSPVARLGTFELIQRLTPLLPPLRSLRIPFSPSISVVRPLAVTNPIFVDVGNDGFAPMKPLPSWATAIDKARLPSGSALTVSGAGPEPKRTGTGASDGARRGTHDHRRGLGRMADEARELLDLARKGQLPQAWQRAVERALMMTP